MDCDGVIGETGVDNSDWMYSSCGDQSDNEGDLGFSDQGTAKAGGLACMNPCQKKNNHHFVTLPSKSGKLPSKTFILEELPSRHYI
jgi:hypothetical protein